jgi:thioredoxin-like negative regulator of GroEL
MRGAAAAVSFATAATLLLACAPRAAADEPIAWVHDYSSALKTARKEGRPVFASFGAAWCDPCVAMEATTYRDSDLATALKNFVPLKVEFFPNSGLAKRYRIAFIPATMVLDAKGEVIASRAGYQSAGQLLAILNAIHGVYESYVKDTSAGADFQAARRAAAFLVQLRNFSRSAAVLESALKRIPKTDVETRDEAELDVAEAKELNHELGGAARLYARLSDTATDRRVRGRALYRLSRVERGLGHPDKAAAAAERLAREFPEWAGKGPPTPELGSAPNGDE